MLLKSKLAMTVGAVGLGLSTFGLSVAHAATTTPATHVAASLTSPTTEASAGAEVDAAGGVQDLGGANVQSGVQNVAGATVESGDQTTLDAPSTAVGGN